MTIATNYRTDVALVGDARLGLEALCPNLAAYFDAPQSGRHFITNRAQGALGFSMAAGIGAAFGRPGAMVVSVMGDGSFGFTCGEMETIVRRGIPLKIDVVFIPCPPGGDLYPNRSRKLRAITFVARRRSSSSSRSSARLAWDSSTVRGPAP